eukprot:11203498-Lingulodinium_polyedra.AAC.1
MRRSSTAPVNCGRAAVASSEDSARKGVGAGQRSVAQTNSLYLPTLELTNFSMSYAMTMATCPALTLAAARPPAQPTYATP